MSSIIRGSDDFDSAFGNSLRALVNFNGAGTVAVRAAKNVSSITDNGVGDYTINFTVALPDANYVVLATGAALAASVTGSVVHVNETNVPTTTAARILSRLSTDGSLSDRGYINVGIFR